MGAIVTAIFAHDVLLLAAVARIVRSTFDAIAVCDSLFYVCDCLVQTLPTAGLAGEVVFSMVLPTDVVRVAFALLAVAVVAEPVVLSVPIEKLAACPGITGRVLQCAVVFEVAEGLR